MLKKLNIQSKLTELSGSLLKMGLAAMMESPRYIEIYGENLFERDISEAIGFTNGD